MSDTDHGPHLPKPTPLGPPPTVPPDRAMPPPPKPVDLATDDVPCRNCGFNLRGLSEDGRCPECGAPIWKSIQEDLLIYSSESYLTSLHRGACCILIAAVLNIAMSIVGIIAGIVAIVSVFQGGAAGTVPFASPANQNLFNAVIQTISLPIALLSLYGWWLLSAPDPGQQLGNKGETPRRVVRIAVIVLAAANIIAVASQLALLANPSLAFVAGGVGLIAGAAGIALFFAAMLYLQWLGPRIPDQVITERAKLYMWLLPVIFGVGICIGGPLIAWVMYLLLLNRVRIAIRDVRERVRQGGDTPPHAQPAT